MHKITTLFSMGILVIYGGKNENLSEEKAIFSDIFVLKLSNFCWISTKIYGTPKSPQASFNAGLYGYFFFLFELNYFKLF